MVFNSATFVVFFAVVLLLARVLRSWTARKAMLLAASLVFYAAWNPPFVLLLLLSTVVDWFVAHRMAAAERPATRRALLTVSLCTNLGLLGYFKYASFFADVFWQMAGVVGVSAASEFGGFDIVLPVGISFYTFQTLSYTIDVYRGTLTPGRSFLDYALYVSFFPQLVAGPIVRASEFLPQCEEPTPATRDELGWGLTLLVFGLVGKMVVADYLLAPVVETIYDGDLALGPIDAWTGTLAFAGQIYCDFAGYTACAIGVALCLGFELPDNFRAPYGAIGFSDFWRRWHISLSEWLRDYLYISLGGNRRGQVRTMVNLMATMLIGGLWHGAAWTYVIWGGLHGAYLAGERMLRAQWGDAPRWERPAWRVVLGAVTFVLVCIAWVFFRASDLAGAMRVLDPMLGDAPIGVDLMLPVGDRRAVWATMALMLVAHVWCRHRRVEEVFARVPVPLRAVALAAGIIALLLVPASEQAFLYFQF